MILPLFSSSFIRGTFMVVCSVVKFFVSVTHTWLLDSVWAVAFVILSSRIWRSALTFWSLVGSEKRMPQLLQDHLWIFSPKNVLRKPSRWTLFELHRGHRGLGLQV